MNNLSNKNKKFCITHTHELFLKKFFIRKYILSNVNYIYNNVITINTANEFYSLYYNTKQKEHITLKWFYAKTSKYFNKKYNKKKFTKLFEKEDQNKLLCRKNKLRIYYSL